ncbi:HlyD family secretion protein [Sodalis praecaptivus]|uniref:HlyD family secretion protein n=1 Tax=Sodalis praecaptivus TaxID=1239307 RepID=W0HQK4_9GAMM|nr:HlyD family secretion protein [Sodalis praecaptivus]AHF76074.1 HlyD family secretion protein [Sodalis praecaptivus]
MSQQGDNPAAAPEKEKSSNARILTIMISAAIALVGVLVILYAWQLPPFTRQVQSTDNAYVRGQVTVISPQLSGYITEVRVQDFAWVRRDEVLMVIDQRIYRQRVHQAQAQLLMKRAALDNNVQQRRSAQASVEQYQAEVINAEAQARKAKLDLQRVENLVADGSLSIRERDASRASASQAVANIAQAKASLEKAKQDLQTVIVNRASLAADVANAQAALELTQIDLANTRIVAPRDGQLGQISVRQGAYVSAGTHLTSLVPEQMWIIANMKETQMAGIRLGQRASFSVDALDHATFSGVVESISPATGSEFSAISSDNATGNFVKIAQRIPVRLRIDHDNALYRRLRPGMSVEVNIDTGSTPADPVGSSAIPGAAQGVNR